MERARSNKHIAPASATMSKVDMTAPSAKPERGKLMKKKGAQAGDPTKMAKPSRPHVKATSGARYGVRVMFQKSEAPEAGATQANGRLLPSVMGIQAPSFKAGMAE
jgi:hypothetical protein